MNLKDINESIYELESGVSTYQTCHKLASLYVVRDHLDPPKKEISGYSNENRQSESRPPIPRDKMEMLFDEMLEAVKLTQPRLYECVMRKLQDIT